MASKSFPSEGKMLMAHPLTVSAIVPSNNLRLLKNEASLMMPVTTGITCVMIRMKPPKTHRMDRRAESQSGTCHPLIRPFPRKRASGRLSRDTTMAKTM